MIAPPAQQKLSELREMESLLANLPVDESELFEQQEASELSQRESRHGQNAAGQSVQYLSGDDIKLTRIQYEDDSDKAVRRWGERRQRLRSTYKTRRLFQSLYSRAYEGRALETVNSKKNKIEPIGLPGWFPDNSLHRIEFNRARPIANEIQAELTTPRGRLEVTARSSSQRDQDGARLANKLVWYLHERKEMRGLEARAALSGILYGECYIKTEWDERRVVCVKDAQDNIVRGMFGDVSFSIVHPGRLYVDPNALCLDEAEWVIEERCLSRTELERQWPDGAQYLRPQDPDTEDWDDDDVRYYFYDYQSELEDIVDAGLHDLVDPVDCGYRVYECYEKSFDSTIGYVWHRTVICRGKVLETGVYRPENLAGEPLTDIYGNEVVWDLPYTHWRYNEVLDRFHGQGLMRDALKPLRFLNWLDSLMAKIGSDAAVKIMVLPHDASNTPFYKNGLVEYRVADPKDVPQFIESGGYPAIILEQVRYYDEMLREVAMRPDVVRGEAPANRSGKAINTLSAEAKGMFEGVRRRFDEAWADAFSKALRLASVMYTEARVLGINEDDGAGSFVIKGVDFQSYSDVRMQYTPFYGHTAGERFEFMAELVDRGAYTPEELRQTLKAGSNEEIVTLPELQARKGREIIYAVQDMPAQEQLKVEAELLRARTEIEAQADQGKIDPMTLDVQMRESQNEVLKSFNIGIGVFDDPIIQAGEIQRAAMMNRFRNMTPSAQAILTLRYDLCMGLAADKMAKAQQAQQAQMGQQQAPVQQQAA